MTSLVVILSEVTKGNKVEGPAFAFALVVADAFLSVIPEGNLLLLFYSLVSNPFYPVPMPRSTKRPAKKLASHDPLTPTPKRKSPPHAFVIEALATLNPEVRRMFSGYSIYLGDRIVLMLRDHIESPEDNGIWLVLSETIDPSDPSLRCDFPSLRTIALLGGMISHWLLIPSDSPTFESEALHACDLLLAHDPRIGRIPKSRQSKPRKR